MKQEVEIEYKNLLTEREYARLKEIYFEENATPFIQENYYFDTKNFILKSHLCALRIRMKESSAELTLKTPFEGHHTETTVDITTEYAQQIVQRGTLVLPDAIVAVLNKENISIHSPVFLIAELKTERLEKEMPQSIIVLDKSYYSNQIDYELEVEAASTTIGETLFAQILKDNKIPTRLTSNKIARAFNAKKENTL